MNTRAFTHINPNTVCRYCGHQLLDRDLQFAAAQIAEMIWRSLVECPPEKSPGASRGNVLHAARQIASCLEILGVP